MEFNEQILYELWGWDTFSGESYCSVAFYRNHS